MNATTVTVCQLEVFPLKSFSGLSLPRVELLPTGPIQNDRRWALFDSSGKLVNAKRTALLHRVQIRFDPDASQLELTILPVEEAQKAVTHLFHWPGEQQDVAELLSDLLQQQVHFQEDAAQGFPDDMLASGPTLIGSATLQKLTEWFPEISVEEFRRRFRSNIELQTSEPFWEDCLFGPPGEPRQFWIGNVAFWGMNPCQRCVVPARDSQTGALTVGFQKQFAALRQAEFPPQHSPAHFNHYYRLAVNTRLVAAQPGQQIQLGDEVRLTE